jgi:hypothetical protein
MDGLIRELGRSDLPVFLHPEAWNRRRFALPGREPVLIASPSHDRATVEPVGQGAQAASPGASQP